MTSGIRNRNDRKNPQIKLTMEELPYYLGSALGIAILVIIWLLATNDELRQNCKEWESRTLGLESDLTEAKIKAIKQDDEICNLKELTKLMLTNAKGLERENKKLRDQNEEIRIELIELSTMRDYENQEDQADQ